MSTVEENFVDDAEAAKRALEIKIAALQEQSSDAAVPLSDDSADSAPSSPSSLPILSPKPPHVNNTPPPLSPQPPSRSPVPASPEESEKEKEERMNRIKNLLRQRSSGSSISPPETSSSDTSQAVPVSPPLSPAPTSDNSEESKQQQIEKLRAEIRKKEELARLKEEDKQRKLKEIELLRQQLELKKANEADERARKIEEMKRKIQQQKEAERKKREAQDRELLLMQQIIKVKEIGTLKTQLKEKERYGSVLQKKIELYQTYYAEEIKKQIAEQKRIAEIENLKQLIHMQAEAKKKKQQEIEERLQQLHNERQNRVEQLKQMEIEALKKMLDKINNEIQMNQDPDAADMHEFPDQFEGGTLKTWDVLGQKFNTKSVRFRLAKKPFSSGAMRHAFFCQLENDLKNYVGKVAIKPTSDNSLYYRDVKMQAEAAKFAEEFNKLNVPKKVTFLTASIIERPSGGILALEEFIEGDYVKYNNNADWVQPNMRNTPQAFSHFTWEFSRKNMMVVDIQGVGDCYTDPQIHTSDGKGDYGAGNLGKYGVDKFFEKHRCNAICSAFVAKHQMVNPMAANHGTDLNFAKFAKTK